MAKDKAKTKKSAKDKLSAGADEIKKAQKELAKAKPEPVEIPELTRSVQEVIRDRVTVMDGNIGLELDKDTTIEESLAVLDWTTQMSDHVGFMIGDVLNFGNTKFGEKYTAALNQTGRAKSTLKNYAWVAANIAPDKRRASLSFTHHWEILRIGDNTKVEKVLEEVGEKADKGEAPSTKELRFKIQKLTPRKKKAPKKATSGKGGKKGKKAKPEPPPYQPDAEEQSKLDAAEEALSAAQDAVKSTKLWQLVSKLDNKEKKRWLEMARPVVDFFNAVDRVTGY